MASLPLPSSELIREPRLLIPKQKPTGPVKIDWQHPLSQGLAGVYLFRDSTNINYVNGRAPTIGRASGYPLALKDEMYFGTHANKAYFDLGIENNLKVAGYYFGFVGGLRMPPIGASTDEHAIFAGWTGILLRFSSWYQRLEWYVTTSGGSASCITGYDSITRNDWDPMVTIGATYAEDGYTRVFLHNGTTSTGSSTTGTVATPASGIYIGADPGNSTDNWQHNMHFMYFWNRGITVDVVNEIRRDPYQILVPV